MKLTSKKGFRLLVIFFVIIGLSYTLVTDVSDNINRIISNNSQIADLEIYYEELISEEISLKSEVTKLNDSDYLARYAKEKYLYSSDGEIIIRFE